MNIKTTHNLEELQARLRVIEEQNEQLRLAVFQAEELEQRLEEFLEAVDRGEYITK